MDKCIREKTVSEEADTIKIATIAAVAKAIKDNAEHRQFRYNGEQDINNTCANIGLGTVLALP